MILLESSKKSNANVVNGEYVDDVSRLDGSGVTLSANIVSKFSRATTVIIYK